MVLADVFAHQNFRKQKTPDMPDSPPSAPEPDSPEVVLYSYRLEALRLRRVIRGA